jgi:hypothetical protein
MLSFSGDRRTSIQWSADSQYAVVAGDGAWLLERGRTDPVRLSESPDAYVSSWLPDRQLLLLQEHGRPSTAVAYELDTGRSRRFETGEWVDEPRGTEMLLYRGTCEFDGRAFSIHAIDLATDDARDLAPGEHGFWFFGHGPGGTADASRWGEVWLLDLDSAQTTILDESRGVGWYVPIGHWVDDGGWFVFTPDPGSGRCE